MASRTTRYDFMSESTVTDSKDNELYPDPLSVTYNDIQFSSIPPYKQVTSADISKFWYFMYKNYGIVELDDILLNINAIPYIGNLAPGDILFLITENDLRNFNTQKLAGEGEEE